MISPSHQEESLRPRVAVRSRGLCASRASFYVMGDDKLTPERAVRLLRAKVGEWEARVRDEAETYPGEPLRPVTEVKADLALVAGILADFMESSGWTAAVEVERSE